MTNVIVVIGSGATGQAIARRVGSGNHVLLADVSVANAQAAALVLADAGFDTSTAVVDVSSRASVHELTEAAHRLGDVIGVIHGAGVSASQASIDAILRVQAEAVRWGARGARDLTEDFAALAVDSPGSLDGAQDTSIPAITDEPARFRDDLARLTPG